MSIRRRLTFSYIAMLIIPIALSFLVTYIIGTFYMKDLETVYNIKFHKISTIEQFVGKGGVLQKIHEVALKSPEMLENNKYLKTLDSQLKKNNSGLVVKKNNAIIYASNSVDKDEIINELPRYDYLGPSQRNHPLIGDKLITPISFRSTDNSRDTLYLITDLTQVKNMVTKFFVTDILAIILIMVLTNAILTFLVSRSIVNPLETLKNGALQIKNGNLNFEVSTTSNDEIGEVCSAFEEMRIRLQESLILQQQYENNRKELISNISHDLKTPITAVKGYVEGIMDGVADSPEKMDRYMKTIQAKSNDLDRLIDELFLFSKLDLNKLPFNLEEFDIKRYLEDCVEELQLDLEEKHIGLELKTSEIENKIIISADREKLKRVITNIVNNAVKYMDKQNGKIEIHLDDVGDFVQIKIADNGQGISEQDLKFIFDRFYRGDPSRNTSTGGTGLGLAISKLIIEDQGGKIWAESKLGEGTAIFFTLKKIKM